MGGKSSRDKGARFERYGVSELKLVFPDAVRGRQSHTAREGDIEGTPIRWECKVRAVWPDIQGALEQADRDGEQYGDDRPRAAMTKKDRTEPLVSFYLRDFIKFCEENLYRPDDEAAVLEFVRGV